MENDISYLHSKFIIEGKLFEASSTTYYASFYIDVSKSGYKPIGVVGWNITSLGSNYSVVNAFIYETDLYVHINETNQAKWSSGAQVGFYILYEKIQ